ncbi:MAG TPA: PD-(D/E)XK nuclease family protein [Jeotgalicoccus aerolatus]|nr:PD-(D/E)XK nuclease family protein [Jeotgalicoccus aerolatus]
MGITIWTGTSGTGKTSQMFNEIEALTKDSPLGSNIYIITPTQNTLSYEQLITQPKDGLAGGSMRTSVFSFTRLMWHVYNELGQPEKESLSEAGHVMFMHKLMDDMKDVLNYYHTSQGYIKFSEKVLEQITEFRAYSVAPGQLNDMTFDKGRTTEKYEDLNKIYTMWNEQISKYNIEDLNMIPHFIDKINQTGNVRTLNDAVIYIDGFHNFTESEFDLIYALEKKVSQINLLLTHSKSDSTEQAERDLQLFRKTEAVITRIQEIFGEDYAEFRHFDDEFMRSKRPGLTQLESYIKTGKKMSNYDGITITESPSVQEEVTEVARNIETLVRDKGAAYSDIGILYRDSAYEEYIKTIFKRFNISFHMDSEHFMHSNPFTSLIIAVLECYKNRFQSAAFLNVLKTGYLNNEMDDKLLAHLENIIIERGLTGHELFDDERFAIEYRLDAEGMIERIDNTEALSEMIAYKNKKLQQLQSLFNDLKTGENVRDYVSAIYNFIVNNGILNKLETEISELEETNMRLRNETEQAYNLFIRLLDDSYTVFKDERVDFSLFYETFMDGLKSAAFNTRPATIDQVIIGLLDLAKVENKKYVFIIGMNYNVMPQESRSNTIVTDEEKLVLKNRGITLSPSARTLAQDERFVFYLGVTRPTDELYISWSKTLHNKETTKLSPFVSEFLPEDPERVLNYTYRKTAHYDVENSIRLISSVRSMEALEHYKIRQLMSADKKYLADLSRVPQYKHFISVYNLLKKDSRQAVMKRMIRNLTYKNRAEKINKETAEILYGEEMKASVSRFQSYFNCHFQHFSNYGLKLNVRQDYTVRPLEIGNLYHNALEKVASDLNMTLQHDDEVIMSSVKEAVQTVLQTISYGIFERSEYYLSLKEKAVQAITTTLLFMKDIEKLGNYKMQMIEAVFGKASDQLGELTLTSPNGKKIILRGKIDRVDTYNADGKVYVNIIDYKSSARDLRKPDVLNGVELQIITYMYVLMNKAEKILGGKVMPNAMLFYHVNEPKVKAETEEEAFKERRSALKPKGLFVGDDNASQIDGNSGLMKLISDSENINDYYPLKEKKDGTFDSYSQKRVMSSTMFEHYSNYVMNKFKTATDEIYDGNTLANPIDTNGGLPCRFCDFKAACHIDKLINAGDYRTNRISDDDIEAFESEVHDG